MNNQSQKLTICSVGDLMICDSPLYASVGVGSKYPEFGSALFCNCRDLFYAADIVIGNFETVVYNPRNRSLEEAQMCCPEGVIADLKKAGFSILNLANNHCMQHGTRGFQKTKETCEKSGIKPIGIRDETPYYISINGISLVFLSLCIHLEWYEPDHILYENRIERILEEITSLRKQDSNLRIIVSIHWGDEFAAYPSNAQIALAHTMVDYGADVILGHHSHVYQGIEEYKNALIVYGQGNFISDMVPEMCRETGVIVICIDGQKKIDYQFHPYWINNDFIPIVAEGKWMEGRKKELINALSGENTDEDYWKAITQNHARAHNDFKTFFKHNLHEYKLRISLRMVWEFIGRKVERLLGTSSDGQVSSMDTEIFKALKK